MPMQTLEMLEKKEKVLLKKAAGEVEKAKEFTKAKNKRGMIWSSYVLPTASSNLRNLQTLSLCPAMVLER